VSVLCVELCVYSPVSERSSAGGGFTTASQGDDSEEKKIKWLHTDLGMDKKGDYPGTPMEDTQPRPI